ncbi:MAG: tyrosine-type recombinase/integrase [Meiothermus sp.]|nr:tyrosine-type recombinase/integrase [Meiothermus sp.]
MPNKKGSRTSKGDGSIRRRKDGLFEAQVSLGYQNGKRIRKSVYGKTEAEIVKKKNALLTLHGLGGVALPDKMTVGEMMAEWLEYKATTVKPTTLDGYRGIVARHITPRLGGMVVQRLEADHLDSLYRAMHQKGLSRNYIRLAHTCLDGALGRLHRKKKLAQNVADLVDALPQQAEQFEAVAWTAQEAQRFLYAIQRDRMWAFYWLALTGSFRRGELLGLRWKSITLEEHPKLGQYVVIRIENNRVSTGNRVLELAPKTHRSKRPVILPYVAWEVLEGHRKSMEAEREAFIQKGYTPEVTDHVFLSPEHTPWHPNNFSTRSWRSLLEAADVPTIRLHDLRHTNITLDLALGGDLKTASQRAGHANIQITANVYQHPDVEQHLEATTRLANLLTPRRGKNDPQNRPN